MTPPERSALAPAFANPAIVPVAYSRSSYRFCKDASGTVMMTLVGREEASVATGSEWQSVPVSSGCNGPAAAPQGQLSAIAPMSSGAGTYHDLTITISVNRDTRYAGYVWLLGGYFSWSNNFPYGADWQNQNPDKFATSWAGGLSLMSDGFSGKYYPSAGGTVSALDISRQSVSANAGVGYTFHEWSTFGCVPQGGRCMANWGQTWQDIQESTYHGQIANVVVEYFHTTGGDVGYTFGFGPASITLTPSTGQPWQVAAYTSFTY